MDAQEIISYIQESKKTTWVKVYVKARQILDFSMVRNFGCEKNPVLVGEWSIIKDLLERYKDQIIDYYVENESRNSAIPLLDLKEINARIEPGAIIREKVEIKECAVIMMGAILNIGAVVGEGSMIDMNAVLGGRAIVGKNCHIGAGSVLAGIIEPSSAKPVIIEDNVMIGANAVVIEGCTVKKGAVVAAGAVVIEDVPENAVVAGCPAKIIKMVDAKTSSKTALEFALRNL